MEITRTSGLNRDPHTEHGEIAAWLGTVEFAWDTERALEFALFRTYAVPSISGLLARTGKFENEPRKRYDDTELLLAEIAENGFEGRGKDAIERINAIHGRFRISNDDMLFVLTTFVCEPVRWCARFAKRPFAPDEVIAWTNSYREMGAQMGISDIPLDYAGFDAFNRAYEAAHFRYAESNKRVGDASVDLLLGFYMPRFLFPLGRPAVFALMDPPLREAMGYPAPSAMVTGLVHSGLALRRGVLRLLPRRRKPRLITQRRTASYPGGYVISQLGAGPDRST